jgi:hypothetical protein
MKHDKHAFITTQHRKCIAHRISGAAVETTIASDKNSARNKKSRGGCCLCFHRFLYHLMKKDKFEDNDELQLLSFISYMR